MYNFENLRYFLGLFYCEMGSRGDKVVRFTLFYVIRETAI